MPKHQSRAAKLARRIQAATGLPYTTALKLCSPPRSWIALADELRAAGLTDAATALTQVAHVCAEAGAWYDAYSEIENRYYSTDYSQVEDAKVCWDEADAALRRASFEPGTFDTDAEVYHCAYLALCAAGSVPDGRTLARAALNVLSSDPTWCSDVIRTRRRTPFSYRSATDLTGPSTPPAVAARQAARAMADASAVKFKGDEEWHEAAGHMVEAVWHASVAAGLTPLQDRPEYQEFLRMFMNGRLSGA